MNHTCHAHGCNTDVPPRMFMCRVHWASLPKRFKDAIWREYRPGQERDKQPSVRYLAVQQAAVAMAAFKPHDEGVAKTCAEYLQKAFYFRNVAMQAGDSDPLDGLWDYPCAVEAQ